MYSAKTLLLATLVLGLAQPAASQDDDAAQIRMMGRSAECVIAGADFSSRRLAGIDLSRAELTDVSFEESALTISVFDGARLENVRFDSANLRGASFVGARLINVSFRAANLNGAIFEGAVLEETDLGQAMLCKTQMPDDDMANDDCD